MSTRDYINSGERGHAIYDPCPDHPGHSFHRTYGYCSCGAGHRAWTDLQVSGGGEEVNQSA